MGKKIPTIVILSLADGTLLSETSVLSEEVEVAKMASLTERLRDDKKADIPQFFDVYCVPNAQSEINTYTEKRGVGSEQSDGIQTEPVNSANIAEQRYDVSGIKLRLRSNCEESRRIADIVGLRSDGLNQSHVTLSHFHGFDGEYVRIPKVIKEE